MYVLRIYKINRRIKIVDVPLKMFVDAIHMRIQITIKMIFRAADVLTLLSLLL